jgi:hypothetical protein
MQFPKRCVFSLFRKNPDDGQSPKTQYLCVSISDHRQNPIVSTYKKVSFKYYDVEFKFAL